MIASGLCLMGGCFAQDESARAVETFWPAEHAEFSEAISMSVLTVLSFSIKGGDSEADSGGIRGVFYNGSGMPGNTIAAGINSTQVNGNTLTGRFHLKVDASNVISFGYGGNSKVVYTNPPESGIEMWAEMERSGARLKIAGEPAKEYMSDYALKDTQSRAVYLRSRATRVLYDFWYSNARTQVRFSIRAMRSLTGASALYDDYNETLIEI